ncbi:MAG: group II intron reverse transcriptase/maturase [Anaerolineaceae bacterium]|nr:group II intron reverse transcriptase/maturase [Anaerolineaceae bacterium]
MHLGKWRSHDPSADRLFSMNALRRAWLQVRRSGKSPGSDQVTPESFEANLDTELNRLRQQLMYGRYQPQPIRRFYIKKASGKERPISIWAIRDRVAQRVVADYLTPLFDAMFLDCSYGFRPGRSVNEAVQAVVTARDSGLDWIVDTDIQDCFGSIDPRLLLGQVEKVVTNEAVIKLIALWLETPVGESRRQVAGVSQGGVISPLLANLYLHRFDEMMLAALPQSRLIRFADDFIVLSQTDDEASWGLDVARRSLENLRLALNMRKTRITNFEEGFVFLGVTFKGQEYRRQPAKPSTDQEE